MVKIYSLTNKSNIYTEGPPTSKLVVYFPQFQPVFELLLRSQLLGVYIRLGSHRRWTLELC